MAKSPSKPQKPDEPAKPILPDVTPPVDAAPPAVDAAPAVVEQPVVLTPLEEYYKKNEGDMETNPDKYIAVNQAALFKVLTALVLGHTSAVQGSAALRVIGNLFNTEDYQESVKMWEYIKSFTLR